MTGKKWRCSMWQPLEEEKEAFAPFLWLMSHWFVFRFWKAISKGLVEAFSDLEGFFSRRVHKRSTVRSMANLSTGQTPWIPSHLGSQVPVPPSPQSTRRAPWAKRTLVPQTAGENSKPPPMYGSVTRA